jgi:hypothetical protein
MLKRHIPNENYLCKVCFNKVTYSGEPAGLYTEPFCWLPSDESIEMMRVLREHGYRSRAIRHCVFVKAQRRGPYRFNFHAKMPINEVVKYLNLHFTKKGLELSIL